MLKDLVINNYALIENLDVDLDHGLTCITGETGAGKSILLGGMSLLLGKRADLKNLKDPLRKCVVEATFHIEKYNLKPLFNSLSLDYDPITIVRREINPSGKSRSYINDGPAKLEVLNYIGGYLIDIHSQNETFSLINSDYQLEVLDALAKNFSLKKEFKNLLIQFNKTDKELEKLENKKEAYNNETEYVRFLIDELNKSKFEEIDLSLLEDELNSLNNIEEVVSLIKSSYQNINDENIGLIFRFNEILNSFSKLSKLSNKYNNVKERLEILKIEFDDINSEIDKFTDSLESDPNRVEVLTKKINLIYNLFKKHKVNSIVELIKVKNELEKKITNSDSLEKKIEELYIIKNKSHGELLKLSIELNKNRSKNIPKLKNELEEILKKIGMKNARFNIELEKSEKFLSHGTDNIKFRFSANKGSEFKLLKTVVSGGELSRIMFSIKIILSRYKSLPTIIFDEIESGVSGDVSIKIAQLMTKMSKYMQVIVISHLPQVAAKGDYHFKVYKESNKNITETKIKLLSKKERQIEIAEMLGGGKNSLTALEHAKQLLNKRIFE
ncbi:MAG: DNA repair protein RecN [Flavobacteriaceae bacterium]|nr:DNA repair protein RecN [Flavobacteriaceae bacterium]